ANGMTVADVIAIARDLRRERDVPILLMGYANPFYRYGLPELARDLAAAGVEGLIVPDLPHEESSDLAAALAPAGLTQICRVATTVERNDAALVRDRTAELLRALVDRNDIRPDDVASAIFTTTSDLDADFPAHAARAIAGWERVPLLCAREIPVPGALQRCV